MGHLTPLQLGSLTASSTKLLSPSSKIGKKKLRKWSNFDSCTNYFGIRLAAIDMASRATSAIRESNKDLGDKTTTLTPQTEAQKRRNNDEAIFPLEILEEIWAHTLAFTALRIVDIRCLSARSGLTSSCPVPSLLHVYRYTRRIALQRWKLSFAADGKVMKLKYTLTISWTHFSFRVINAM